MVHLGPFAHYATTFLIGGCVPMVYLIVKDRREGKQEDANEKTWALISGALIGLGVFLVSLI